MPNEKGGRHKAKRTYRLPLRGGIVQKPIETPVAKQRDASWKIPLILPAKYFCHAPQGSSTCGKISWHGARGFTSPPKKVVLRILIALKHPSPSTGFQPANHGSNGKYDNHQTAINDQQEHELSDCEETQVEADSNNHYTELWQFLLGPNSIRPPAVDTSVSHVPCHCSGWRHISHYDAVSTISATSCCRRLQGRVGIQGLGWRPTRLHLRNCQNISQI
jgi:hypothetical protein